MTGRSDHPAVAILGGRGLLVVLALVAAASWAYLVDSGDWRGLVTGVPATGAAAGVLLLRRLTRQPPRP